jgi:GNAT superfamily N-acetyltransferase
MTDTIPLSLDGYTDLPPGKIANVVTFFEHTAPVQPEPLPVGLAIEPVAQPAADWFRDLYRAIGMRWLWFSRAAMSDAALAALLAEPTRSVLALARDGETIGMAEIDFAERGTAEIVTFGVVPKATGTGVAALLMNRALVYCRARGAARVWLHTCTFDHPGATRFYSARGFKAYKFAVEVSDDPRATGHLPRDSAPHIPLIATAAPL